MNESLKIEQERECIQELVDAIEKAIVEFQWVTNGIKMNEHQHIRLGDTLVSLDHLVKHYREHLSKGPYREGPEEE